MSPATPDALHAMGEMGCETIHTFVCKGALSTSDEDAGMSTMVAGV